MSADPQGAEGTGLAPAVAPYHPPPSYPPPQVQRTGRTEGRTIASLLAGLMGILLGLPLGIPGLTLGPLAYFLGKSAVGRIDASNGELGGRSTAVAGWVLGIIATAIGCLVTLIWLVVVGFAVAGPPPT